MKMIKLNLRINLGKPSIKDFCIVEEQVEKPLGPEIYIAHHTPHTLTKSKHTRIVHSLPPYVSTPPTPRPYPLHQSPLP